MKKMMIMALVLIACLTGGLKAYRRGYQQTINRAQRDQSRRMMRRDRRPTPVRSTRYRYGQPRGESLEGWTQNVEAQELMGDMGGQ